MIFMAVFLHGRSMLMVVNMKGRELLAGPF